jgi:multiple sugar transport system ATP-binding protein
MATVELRGVRKSFGSVPVLHGVDLAIADGEFLVLLGPSGCGKSTLLRLVAGLEDADDGDIRIGGRVVDDLEPRERGIAMVFQSYALYPHMTVAENIGFALRMAGTEAGEARSRVERAAEILGLTPLLGRLPRQLSGGQRQRVAMGRALVRDTQVFLFDEPLSNLDAKLRVQMRVEIRALHRRMGVTSIYVTHDQIEAMTLADRVVVMREGRVEQVGTPLEIYDDPANVFVAEFMGAPAMNLLPARIEGGQAVLRDGTALALPEALRRDADEGRAILYGIRPQDLVPSDAGGLSCAVDVVEPTGSETLIHASLGQGQALCAATGERVALAPGASIRLAPRPGRACVFDAASGARL